MAYDPTKHDITLNGQDYRVLSRQRDSAPEFVSKFNTGEQGENDLDIFKSKSTNTVAGGQWQPRWVEDTMVASVVNGYFNEVDKMTYPTPDEPATGIAALSVGIIDQLIVNDNQLFAIGNNGTNTAAQYTDIDKSQNTIITTPASFDTAIGTKSILMFGTAAATSLALFAGDDSGNSFTYSWDKGSTTISTWHSGTSMYLIAESRGTLYGISSADLLYTWSGSAWVSTGFIVGNTETTPLAMFEFNGRVWIAKEEGLFQYDGTQVVRILEYSNNHQNDAFKKRAILHGWLYYMMEGFLYRFNGATVEKLRDFRGYTIADICAGKDRIWVLQDGGTTWVNDKTLYSASKAYIHVFDEVGWYTWKEYTDGTGPASKIIYWYGHIVTAHDNDTPTSSSYFHLWDLDEEFTPAGDDPMTIETSEFNANFPNIEKNMSRVEVDHEALGASDTIGVHVRFYDGVAWGSYTDLGDITTTTDNYIDLQDQGVDGSFYSCQVKVIMTRVGASNAGIRDISFRYVIVPENRFRWVMTLGSFNEDLDDNVDNPNALRYAIEGALESNTPVDLLDVHWTLLDEALDASETGVDVNDAQIFKEGDIMLVDSEKMKITSIDTGANTLTVERGHRNTTAATHDDDTRVYVNQEVYATRLINEVLVPRDNQDRGDDDGTQYDTTWQVEIIEA